MSTKADIRIKGEAENYIYVRHDGFPESIVPYFIPLIKEYFDGEKEQTLLEFLSKKLNISLTDECYTEEGFGLHSFFVDGRDPWRKYEYVIRKNGDIDAFNHFDDCLIRTYYMEQ